MTTIVCWEFIIWMAIFTQPLDISIDGDTAVAFTENVEQRFLAYGWQVLHVDNGDTSVEATRITR
jgi:transketolase